MDATNALFPLPSLDTVLDPARETLKNTVVLGIHAGAQSGKDEVSKVLLAHGFLYTAFAAPGKAAAQHVFGLTDEQTWDDAAKEIIVPHLGMTPREVFQRFLTEVCRGHINDDIWVRNGVRAAASEFNRARAAGTPYQGVVFQDTREEHEAAAVRSLGGTVWHLQRHMPAPTETEVGNWRATDRSHSSEQGIARVPGEPIIVNDGTIAELQDTAKQHLADIMAAPVSVHHSAPTMG